MMYSSVSEVYIYLWGFRPHGSSPFSDGFNREMESSPPFTDPSLREVPIGGCFLHSWPAYPADSTSLGRYRPSVRMASGNAILAPSLFGNNFLRKLLYRFSLRSPTSSNPFGSGACRFSFFMQDGIGNARLACGYPLSVLWYHLD